MNPRIFVSATSHDLSGARDMVVRVLAGLGHQARVQPNLPFTGGDLRDKLRHFVDECDLVIQLVGFHYGQEPPTVDPSYGRVSYTQFEARHAERCGKRVLYVLLPECFPFGRLAGESQELAALQLTYREGLRSSGVERGEPSDAIALENLILHMRDELLPVEKQQQYCPRIAATRIRHGAEHFLGRESELAALDDALEDSKTHVLSIIAWGGSGKTSLVVEWMNRLSANEWRTRHNMAAAEFAGARAAAHPRIARVFDWCFYSRDPVASAAVSAESFISEALAFFGDTSMSRGNASPHDKGARLAELVAETPTLLVLDGLEPLLFPPGELGAAAGKLRDDSLEALLKGLAQKNPGLCLVTSRESVADLRPYRHTATELHLKHLPESVAVRLLKKLGVSGAEGEFRNVINQVKGHALTLNLLGRYLVHAWGCDIIRWREIPFDQADTEMRNVQADSSSPYGHASNVIRAYERWLLRGSEWGSRQVALLRLLALFDRPIESETLLALRQPPVISKLTEPLVELNDYEWRFTLRSLEECGLISLANENLDRSGSRICIDTHHIVREYFARDLRLHAPENWSAAHSRLFDYFRRLPREHRPETRREMESLFSAVVHGCHAGRHHEALHLVYWDRIVRKKTTYQVRPNHEFRVETPQSMLTILSGFFDQLWNMPRATLEGKDAAIVLEEAGHYLFVLGRLEDARQPLAAAIEARNNLGSWRQAARDARLLRELHLLSGELDQAEHYAVRSVELADRSDSFIQQMVERAGLAQVLHHRGKWLAALQMFREAGKIQARRTPDRPWLFGVAGFWYCELLLDLCRKREAPVDASRDVATIGKAILRVLGQLAPHGYQSVEDQAVNMFRWARENGWPMDAANGQLMLGLAMHLDCLSHGVCGSTAALVHIGSAVQDLRATGQQHHLAHSLLIRASMRADTGDYTGAKADLDKAWHIAERGPMRLQMADIHLHRAQLFLREKEYPWNKNQDGTRRSPADDFAAAEQLINACGYHRRDEELAAAKRVFLVAHRPPDYT